MGNRSMPYRPHPQHSCSYVSPRKTRAKTLTQICTSCRTMINEVESIPRSGTGAYTVRINDANLNIKEILRYLWIRFAGTKTSGTRRITLSAFPITGFKGDITMLAGAITNSGRAGCQRPGSFHIGYFFCRSELEPGRDEALTYFHPGRVQQPALTPLGKNTHAIFANPLGLPGF
jgi:hypothetical protein